MSRNGFDFNEHHVELPEKIGLINEFLTTEGMVSYDYKRGSHTIRVIDDGGNGIDSGHLAVYLGAHEKALKRGSLYNCFDVAKGAVADDCATGRIATDYGANNLVDTGNHCICYDELDNGGCIAVDLTASTNIDERKGNFDVLAVTAKDLNQLLSRVGKLFGGEWVVIQDD